MKNRVATKHNLELWYMVCQRSPTAIVGDPSITRPTANWLMDENGVKLNLILSQTRWYRGLGQGSNQGRVQGVQTPPWSFGLTLDRTGLRQTNAKIVT